MKNIISVVFLSVALVLSVRSGYAEFDASLCFSGCATEHGNCNARIATLDEPELSDQRAACDREKSACFNRCDAERENAAREREEKSLQQQDQPPQEQPPQDQQEQQEQPQQEQQ